MKYHTDVPSTIPSLHTWIRLRESPISRGCICSIRPRKENNLCIYLYSPLLVSFFIRLGLNKYRTKYKREGGRERNSIEILGKKGEKKKKKRKILAVCCLTKSNGWYTSPRSSPRAGTEKGAFIIGNDACDTGERIAGTVDYTGQTHKLHPMAFVLLSSIILALCTPPQESSD